MVTSHKQVKDRRSFLKFCGRLAPGCVLLGSLGGTISPASAQASATGNLITARTLEIMYRDGHAGVYLLELNGNEQVIGLGPDGLAGVSQWPEPQRFHGQLPSVIFHPELDAAARSALHNRLADLD